jgi:opacity protein-like surface antigen
VRKQHVFSLSYRYQAVNSGDDDNDVNSHLIGLGYKYKF